MENIKLYEACVQVEHRSIEGDKTLWDIIGLFKNKQDAEYAVQIYEKACRIKGNIIPRNHYVDEKLCPKRLNLKYYENLDRLINKNDIVMECTALIGAEGMKKLLEEIGAKIGQEKSLRIIERMIKHYKYQIKINENIPAMQTIVEEDKENVRFLEDLRDGKIELK